MPDRLSPLVFWAIVACSLAISLFAMTTTISLDDPFIGLRYANNFVQGDGIVYNPGDPIEGYTALLWILVAALGMALGFEPLGFWQCVALPMNVLTLWMVFVMGRRPGQPLHRALLAPALVATHVAFVSYPMTGMETTCLVMLTTLAVFIVHQRAHLTRAGALALGVVLFLMCLDRFDAPGLVALILVPQLFVDREIRKTIPTIAVLGIGLLVYNVWRVWYYGDWLPNTFHAKTSTLADQLERGVRYTANFTLKGGPYFLLLIMFPLALRRLSRLSLFAAWIVIMHMIYVTLVGGDWMPAYRFVVPVLPLLCLVLQDSTWVLFDKAKQAGVGAPLRQAALSIGVVAMLVLNVLPFTRSEFYTPHGPDAWFIETHAKDIGEALNEKLPAEALVALEWAGIIPFYMQQPMLDIFGLSDREIIQGPFVGSAMGRGITAEYLAGRNPAVVLFCGRHYATREQAEIGIDCRKNHAFLYEMFSALNGEKLGYEVCITRVGEAYYPLLVRSDLGYKAEICK